MKLPGTWFRVNHEGTTCVMSNDCFVVLVEDTKCKRFTWWGRFTLAFGIVWWMLTRKFPTPADVTKPVNAMTFGDQP